MKFNQSTINKTILSVLASLTLASAADILNGIDVPEEIGN